MKYPDLYKVRNPEMRLQLEEAFRNYMGDKPITGDIYFVDDSGSANGSGTFDSPITTVDLANDLCTAGNNDVIFLKPGHAENLASSTACVLNLKGVTVIGLGNGEERPKLTVITAADAGIVVSGASVSIFNVILICNKDGATSLLKITGTGFTGDIEIRDTSNTVEAAVGVLTEATADYLNLKLKYQGFTDGSGTTTAVRLVGADYARLSVDFYGKTGTSVVEAHTTAVKNLVMYNMHVYNQGDTTYAKAFVDTVGGSTWSYKGFCGENGVNVSGSQDTAISATDTSGITAALAVVDAFHDVPTADTADNVVMSDVIGNKTDTVAGDSIYALALQLIALLGTPAADVSADIAAIKTIVDALNTASITEIADILAAVDTEVADILTDTGTTIPALYAVPSADSANNSNMRDVIGNKTDTTGGNSVIALLKAIKAITDALPDSGALSTIDGYFDIISAADAVTNTTMRDVIGRKDDTVAGDSIVALAKQIIADTDVIGTIVNAGGTATLGALLGDFANVALVTRLANLQTEADKIGTIVNAGGTATIGGVFGDFANVALVTRLANIQTEVDKIGTIVNAGGTATIGGVLGDFANVSAVTRFGNIQTEVDKIETPSNACIRQMGKTQIYSYNITSAANAGVTTVGTITTQSCMIKRIVLMSNGATTADLTSAAIEGGNGQAVEFISAATAVKASIDALDEQVSFSGAAVLNAADTITVDLQGTGATAVDLTVFVEYCACVNGGYIA